LNVTLRGTGVEIKLGAKVEFGLKAISTGLISGCGNGQMPWQFADAACSISAVPRLSTIGMRATPIVLGSGARAHLTIP
jgi:hypothetical protein